MTFEPPSFSEPKQTLPFTLPSPLPKVPSSPTSSPTSPVLDFASLTVIPTFFESQRKVRIPDPFNEGVPKTSVYNVAMKLNGSLPLPLTELQAGLWRVTDKMSRQSDVSWNYEGLSLTGDELMVRKVKFKDCSYTSQHCCFVIGIFSSVTKRIVFCSGKFKVLARKRKKTEGPKIRINRHYKTTVVKDHDTVAPTLFVDTKPALSPLEVKVPENLIPSHHCIPDPSPLSSARMSPLSQVPLSPFFQELPPSANFTSLKTSSSSGSVDSVSASPASPPERKSTPTLSLSSLAADAPSPFRPSENSAFSRVRFC